MSFLRSGNQLFADFPIRDSNVFKMLGNFDQDQYDARINDLTQAAVSVGRTPIDSLISCYHARTSDNENDDKNKLEEDILALETLPHARGNSIELQPRSARQLQHCHKAADALSTKTIGMESRMAELQSEIDSLLAAFTDGSGDQLEIAKAATLPVISVDVTFSLPAAVTSFSALLQEKLSNVLKAPVDDLVTDLYAIQPEDESANLRENNSKLPYLSSPLPGFTSNMVTIAESSYIKRKNKIAQDEVESSAAIKADEIDAAGFTSSSIGLTEGQQASALCAAIINFQDIKWRPFKAVTHGQFRVLKLNIDDKFGQFLVPIDQKQNPRFDGHLCTLASATSTGCKLFNSMARTLPTQ
ncbi:hypothetical protein F4859DRAFT_518489 [Xylaria cf. heliscus]|nr:hypothetical protein F4859DRAFT_518489 [Xylaria cf. heliscus]